MADQPTSSAGDAWASITNIIDTVHQQLQAGTGDIPAAEERLVAAEELLLTMKAPNIDAVIRKLQMLWEYRLEGMHLDAVSRRQILDDLRHLAAA
ncbi:hypothetical protein [Novosphingobium album (ex Hu et al. 2023)]|uniref:Uncharacterized protein n=1 Tax=Novosphingobium album (ex Hu et al. 2023) TaxID=2930093 RepID=A0ABT0B6Y7_9SPHN|nr:hypothetical protein [Novosphingobium album (ex Hu et al. 2023)]MCJ2180820.1 hypothetical protein [Novosphingobium album (ex Hu et al. 2023)]